MLTKYITFFNWAVIALLAFLLLLEAISPAKGGDAAGRGMGQAILYLAAIALVVLLILNLIPHRYAKYAAFGLVLVPVALWWITPRWRAFQRAARYKMEQAKPIFEDPTLDALARACRDGDVEKWSALLAKSPDAVKGQELLSYAIAEAGSNYRPEEKLECVRRMFQAGATLGTVPADTDLHYHAASSGNVGLLRLLLEKGASPNASQPDLRPILFEAVSAYSKPEATTKLLLEFGAKTDVTMQFYEEENNLVSPLYYAAWMGRWGVCAVLLEHGADSNFKIEKGTSFRDLVRKAEGFTGNGYATREDFERVKALLGRK